MAEYIEREALLKEISRRRNIAKMSFPKQSFCVGDVLHSIYDAPTADVVEVVRCKDCTMWERNRISCEGRARCLTGEGGTRYRGRNDFCSIGIKMDGKGEGE